MPAWGPVSRANLIRALRKAGFTGPYVGGKHQAMRRGTLTVILPNPHRGDIGVGLLSSLLRQAGINRPQWEAL